MKFSLWTDHGARNSKPVFAAFAESLLAAGHDVVYNETGADKDVIWSVLWKGKMQANKSIFSKDTIVLEVGGIQRNVTWKVAIGGINREAYFGENGNGPGRAGELGLKLKSWHEIDTDRSGSIIICCQNRHSWAWRSQPSTSEWLNGAIASIRKRTDRPVVIRPHPRDPLSGTWSKLSNVTVQRPVMIRGTYDDFDYNPLEAWAVVNWSSNPATEAVMNGIPVFTGPDSLAWDVANHSLETIDAPATPDRTQWLNDLAYTEWTVEEIQKGLPLKRLTDRLF
jgi:hypothetical protein